MDVASQPQVFRLAWPTWAFCAFFGAITLLVAAWTVQVVASEPAAFVVFWLCGLSVFVWVWYHLLVQVSYEVRFWPGDGRVMFRSILREKRTTLTAIRSISRSFNNRLLIIEFDADKARVTPMGPMLDFVREVEKRNPATLVDI